MTEFKVLVVGYGNSGKRFYNILKEINQNFKVKVLLKSLPKNKNRRKFLYTNKEAIIFNPNLVIISSPISTHVDYCIFFAKNKINILVEKPLSNDLKKINILKKIVDKNKIFFHVAYNLQYLDILKKFKYIINKKNYLNNSFYLNCCVGHNIDYWNKTNKSKKYSLSNRYGGGALLELSHELEYIVSIFGKIKNLNSKIYKLKFKQYSAEDTFFGTFSFKDSKLKCKLSIDLIREDYTRYMELISSFGTLKLDFTKNMIFLKKNNKNINLYKGKISISQTYKIMIKDVISNIRKNNKANNLKSSEYIIKIIKKFKNI